jgi:hypothetical protein
VWVGWLYGWAGGYCSSNTASWVLMVVKCGLAGYMDGLEATAVAILLLGS